MVNIKLTKNYHLTELKKKTTEDFLQELKDKNIHPEYNYSKVVYTGNKGEIIVGCPIHGDFYSSPDRLLRNYGCPACAGNKKKTTETFLQELKDKNIHPEYDYSKVNYVNEKTDVIVICNKHEDGPFAFPISPDNLLHGKGCPKCARNIKKTTDIFLQELKDKNIHPEYDYSKVDYINYSTKVLVGCKKHGFFPISPDKLIHGQGCPKCQDSKGELAIKNWLSKNLPTNHISQLRDDELKDKKSLSYDFGVKYNNKSYVIEFNGVQHYRPQEFYGGLSKYMIQQNHDKKKREFAESKGIIFIEIPYSYLNKIDQALTEIIFNGKDPKDVIKLPERFVVPEPNKPVPNEKLFQDIYDSNK